MFRKADLVLLTKVDLLPHLPGFRLDALEDALARTMPQVRMIRLSAVSGEGLPEWIAWLEARRAALPPPTGRAHRHDASHGTAHEHSSHD